MERHKEVHTLDANKFKTDWKEKVNIPREHEAHRDDIVDMISELEHIWDGQLDIIRAAKHRIELTSDQVLPVNSAPYRAGTTAR